MAMVVAPDPPTAPVTPQQRESPPADGAAAGWASVRRAWTAEVSCSGVNGASRMSEASIRSTLRTTTRIVSIDQEHQIFGLTRRKVLEGSHFQVVRLDKRVRHRDDRWNAIPARRFDGRSRVKASDIARAARQASCLGPVSASHAEIDQFGIRGRQPSASSLRRD